MRRCRKMSWPDIDKKGRKEENRVWTRKKIRDRKKLEKGKENINNTKADGWKK